VGLEQNTLFLRHLEVAGLGSLLCLSVACGSANDAAVATTKVDFHGVYRGAPGGPIDMIAFANGTEYLLLGSTCEPHCVERGTYRFDAAHGKLTLTNASGRTSSLEVRVLESLDSSTGQAQLLPRNLVGPGEKPLVEKGGKLVNSIDDALIENQQVKLLDYEKNETDDDASQEGAIAMAIGAEAATLAAGGSEAAARAAYNEAYRWGMGVLEHGVTKGLPGLGGAFYHSSLMMQADGAASGAGTAAREQSLREGKSAWDAQRIGRAAGEGARGAVRGS
jgi:hypothetical protein